jgi:hypothetical protein
MDRRREVDGEKSTNKQTHTHTHTHTHAKSLVLLIVRTICID